VKQNSLPCGPRQASLTCGATWPDLLAVELPFCSRVLGCPLELSRQFLRNSDLIWFGSLAPTPPQLILF
jgi:hypothetical protein